MLVQLKVYRYQPEKSDKPYYQTFEIEADRKTACWICWSMCGVIWIIPWPTGARARTGCAAQMPCASTARTRWPARCW
jgi:hypothetical protein